MSPMRNQHDGLPHIVEMTAHFVLAATRVGTANRRGGSNRFSGGAQDVVATSSGARSGKRLYRPNLDWLVANSAKMSFLFETP